jgi:hypothetical protein
VKLFQIEEPEGGPADPSAAGAAIGIDASGRLAEVAFSVGGNGLVLSDREGFEQVLSVPGAVAIDLEWREMFEKAKVRAERALARPVTHAVVVLDPESAKDADRLRAAAREAGLEVLRFLDGGERLSGSAPAIAAASIAEDLAPRQEPGG